nr:MAG TPA: hypothetical protein [Caudoviricetes sp.]
MFKMKLQILESLIEHNKQYLDILLNWTIYFYSPSNIYVSCNNATSYIRTCTNKNRK